MEDQQVCDLDTNGTKKKLACGPKNTLYSAAVTSPATARLACELGFQISADDSVKVKAGLHADIQTLTVLRELGVLLSDIMVNAVALSGRVDILQHLLSERTCPRLRLTQLQCSS
jgi:hypothetical protein